MRFSFLDRVDFASLFIWSDINCTAYNLVISYNLYVLLFTGKIINCTYSATYSVLFFFCVWQNNLSILKVDRDALYESYSIMVFSLAWTRVLSPMVGPAWCQIFSEKKSFDSFTEPQSIAVVPDRSRFQFIQYTVDYSEYTVCSLWTPESHKLQ